MMALRWISQAALVWVVSAMVGCALFGSWHARPLLQLTPASLGRELMVSQRMEVQAAGQTRSLDVALEVDSRAVRLAVMQFGQTVARLDWDGQTLTQSLAPGWPKVISAERVLSDLQLVWWPADVVRSALPLGWRLVEASTGRMLYEGDNLQVEVRVVSSTHIELIQHAEGYTVQLHSQGAAPGFASP